MVVLVVLVVVVVVVVSAWITVVHFCCFRGLVFRSWGAGGGGDNVPTLPPSS